MLRTPGWLLALLVLVLGAPLGAATVADITSAKPDGTYRQGAVIDITVTFDAAVAVSGSPVLNLDLGAVRSAAYLGGSGTAVLIFRYTVQAGDTSADLDALSLTGGTINNNGTGTAADRTIPTGATSGSLASNRNLVIDNTAPTVTGASVTSPVSAVTAAKTGDDVTISVTFSEAVTVVGTVDVSPTMALNSGGTARYSTGSGTTTLTFKYKVAAGNSSADLDYTSTAPLNLLGGSIADAAGNPATLTFAIPGNVGSLSYSHDLRVDGVVPTVTGVSANNANGAYTVGTSLMITASFSEPVLVSAPATGATLALASGTATGSAIYESGSGTNVLTFIYTVRAGDSASDLDYTASTALAVAAGTTIADAAGNAATLTLPAPGSAGSLGANKALVLDTEAPTVNAVSATTADGSYKAGKPLSFTVTFSKQVFLAGPVAGATLALASGTATGSSAVGSALGGTVLTLAYTVLAGDSASDLDYTAINALVLAGGTTIRDAAGNDADLTLATPGATGSLGANKDLVLDTAAPRVTGVSATNPDGAYGVGKPIAVTVTLSEPVTVSGTANLLLNISPTTPAPNASYATNSAGVLTFTYTVKAGDAAADLDYAAATALTLGSGATVRDAAGNDLDLTLPAPGAPGSLGGRTDLVIDTVAPVVTGVTSSAADGTKELGTAIPITVTFSKPVTVTGATTLALNTGRTAVLTSTSSTSPAVVFTYTVQAGDSTSDLDYASAAALTLGGGAITDDAGNNAVLTLPAPGAAGSLGANKDLAIDGVAPTVVKVSGTAGSYAAGALIPLLVQFSTPVTVTGRPVLALSSSATATAAYITGSGSDTLTFVYVVATGDLSADLDYRTTGSLTLDGGTIRDTVGNDATLTLPAIGSGTSLAGSSSLVIDAVAPTVLRVDSGAANATYGAGFTIPIAVVFSEPVTVASATATMALNVGTGAVATYSSGSGTSTLTFSYTVLAGQSSPDLDYAATSSLSAGSGTIRDAIGNDAVLTLATPGATGSLSAAKEIIIDTTAPTVVSLTTTTTTGAYPQGTTIPVTVTFNEPVTVTGSPTIALNSGGSAVYSTGSGTAALTFIYIVGAGHATTRLDNLSTTALGGGAIRDVDGNPVVPTLPAPGTSAALGGLQTIAIFGAAPTVVQLVDAAVSTTTHYAKRTESVQINVQFSAPMTVVGLPTLSLGLTGGGVATATYASTLDTPGDTIVPFTYTVTAGQNSPQLDVTNTSALVLHGGSLRDPAGNNAVLAVPAPGDYASLGYTSDIVVDTTAPMVASLTSSTPNGTYGVGTVIDLTVTFNETAAVSGGTPTLTLNTTPTPRILSATATGATLTFRYTVAADETSAGLDAASTAALDLNGATLTDLAGNTSTTVSVPVGTTGGALAANTDLVIDTTAPIVSGVDSTAADATYGVGAIIPITVTFNKSVTVTGLPKLTLNTVPARTLTAAVSSGTVTSLTFKYTVVDGDNSASLDAASTAALTLSGATIRDAAGNDAVLTLPVGGTAGSLASNTDLIVKTSTTPSPDPAKPDANGGGDGDSGSCGVGSGIALVLFGGLLLNRRRRRG